MSAYFVDTFNFRHDRINSHLLKNKHTLSIRLADAEEEILKLRAQLEEACKVVEMVEDNRKMPHPHTDYHTRLCCLAERASEALKIIKEVPNDLPNNQA